MNVSLLFFASKTVLSKNVSNIAVSKQGFHTSTVTQMPFIGIKNKKSSQRLKDISHPYVYPGDYGVCSSTFVYLFRVFV